MNGYRKKLTGWGRVSSVNTLTVRPEYISDLQKLCNTNATPMLAYGCGRSYGDEALNGAGTTILTERMNRLLSFDAETLTLVCEAGVTLYDIQNTFLPRGYALITSPGTATVTVTGAIANDVHGKNHDQVGSFGDHVHWFDLLLATGEIVRCSRDERPEIFAASIGGLGLTGVITTVCLQLQRHPMIVRVKNEVIPNLSDFIARLSVVRDQATYSVGWIDMMVAKRQSIGRCILSTAEPAEIALDLKTPTIHTAPYFASALLNRWSARCFNRFYYRHEKRRGEFTQDLQSFLYPLDHLKHWNHLYGKHGFYQFQCVIPDANVELGITELIETVHASALKPYLAVIKTLGGEGRGLLSFPLRGMTIALDFPNKRETKPLLKKLADITAKHQGRVYLAKDACLEADHMLQMYPRLAEFRTILDHIDPDKRWQSVLAKRLNIRMYDE